MNDIAERAGVSRPTVSVVLNDRHEDIGIAEETRLKVLAVAKELGYRRNELARAVKTGKSLTLGFLSGTVHMEYASRSFSGLLDAAENRGYSIQRFRIGDAGVDQKAVVRCVEHRLAGVVVYDPDSQLPFDEMRTEFEAHGLPAVLLDFKKPIPWGIGVSSDDEMGARQAVEHLVELGHRRITFLGGIEYVGTGIPRASGYKQAMCDLGCGDYIQMAWTRWQIERIEKHLDHMMASPNRPTAILCGSDPTAMLSIRYLRSKGISVPHDVSIVGFGDLSMSHLSDPALTTVAVPYEQMGKEAVRILLDEGSSSDLQLRARSNPPIELIPTRLTVRNSTAAPRL